MDEQARVWTGVAPALADGFIARPQSGPALAELLVPGATVALVPEHTVPDSTRTWRDSAGKTQLAVSCARSLWQDETVDTVIWVSATSRAAVLSCYAEAAVALGAGGQADGPDAAALLAARLAGWFRETSRSWLVVLDDLAESASLARLWPAGPAGRVLVTAADPAALHGHPAQIVPVGPFSRREALTYLMGRITTDLDQRQGAIDLVADLGQEPMALAQASAVIASSELTCHEYRDHFARRRAELTAPGGRAQGGDPPAAAITWTLSVDHADILSPGTAQAVLMIAALLDGDAIPRAVFQTPAMREYAAAGDAAVQHALTALEQSGLLRNTVAPDPVTRMSWLVQAAVRAAMAGGVRDAARAAADALVAAWPPGEPVAWLARGLRSCADSVRRAAGDLLWDAGGCHPVLLRAGDSLDAARLTEAAVAHWTELAAVSGRLLGREHPMTLLLTERLGRARLRAGQAAESVSLFEWVRNERARHLGPDHPDTAAASQHLGSALAAAGRLDEATVVLGEAIVGYERSLGADSVAAIAALEELAGARRASTGASDAITLYQRAVSQRERIQGPRHPGTLTARQHLADTYLADGQAKTAISQYKRLIADRERVLGPDHLDTIATRCALASAHHAAGRMASAVALYEQARAEYTGALGPDHPDTLRTCVHLAHVYYGTGRVTDAEKLLADTVTRCELSLPAADPLTATARASLANITGGDP